MPPRWRSRVVTRLVERELARSDDALAAACRAANSDPGLEREIDEWQALAEAHPPITVPITCQGKPAVAVIDQIRAVGKHRLQTRVEAASVQDLAAVADAVAAILALS